MTDDPDFWNSVRVTLVFTVASVMLTLGTALALAMLLAGGRAIEVNVRTLLVIPFAMSPALLGISWRFLLNPEFGAADAVLKGADPAIARPGGSWQSRRLAMCALVMVDVWHWAPYFMLTFVGALASLPQDTIDAAEVDGAGRLRAFFQVILPQLRPVLAITILLKTIFSLKMLDQVVTMTSGGPGSATTTLALLDLRDRVPLLRPRLRRRPSPTCSPLSCWCWRSSIPACWRRSEAMSDAALPALGTARQTPRRGRPRPGAGGARPAPRPPARR